TGRARGGEEGEVGQLAGLGTGAGAGAGPSAGAGAGPGADVAAKAKAKAKEGKSPAKQSESSEEEESLDAIMNEGRKRRAAARLTAKDQGVKKGLLEREMRPGVEGEPGLPATRTGGRIGGGSGPVGGATRAPAVLAASARATAQPPVGLSGRHRNASEPSLSEKGVQSGVDVEIGPVVETAQGSSKAKPDPAQQPEIGGGSSNGHQTGSGRPGVRRASLGSVVQVIPGSAAAAAEKVVATTTGGETGTSEHQQAVTHNRVSTPPRPPEPQLHSRAGAGPEAGEKEGVDSRGGSGGGTGENRGSLEHLHQQMQYHPPRRASTGTGIIMRSTMIPRDTVGTAMKQASLPRQLSLSADPLPLPVIPPSDPDIATVEALLWKGGDGDVEQHKMGVGAGAGAGAVLTYSGKTSSGSGSSGASGVGESGVEAGVETGQGDSSSSTGTTPERKRTASHIKLRPKPEELDLSLHEAVYDDDLETLHHLLDELAEEAELEEERALSGESNNGGEGSSDTSSSIGYSSEY
ncbi:unnamed protein product, partial [Discosporangium mesarthrocarpum]